MNVSSPHDSRLTIHDILKRYWGFDTFRPLQEEIITSIVNGNDTLALMPTGGGKSLCYQVPGLIKEGLCLVISPLIALMKDQVENLRRKNITAFAVYSGMSRQEVMHTLKTAVNSNCKFLYVSPERLETSLFKEYLPGMDINLIAVDEAHCISQWGYDFRPSYLRIAVLRDELPGIPALALTASATVDVQEDICDKLHFKTKTIFRQSFERANLSYSVFKVDSKINKLIEILKNVQGSSIVYCKSRRRTKEISDLLLMHGISSEFYHAGLTQEERNRKQEGWINNRSRVIVCTNAFGMGIDKPDVRVVVHADSPDCLENYYQEAGRAGRDGKKSYAVLLYNERDLEELENAPAIRFPSIEEIKVVYQAIANYLQIPSGSGEGEYFAFDVVDFIKKFYLNSQTAVYALKALEQDGRLSFNEQTFLSSTVQFICDKNYLYEFEKNHPELDPVIKSLLRAYEGIFDNPCFVSENQLQRLLNTDKENVRKQLQQLHSYRIINYQPQRDGSLLLFLRNRVRIEDLSVDLTALNHRKKKFITRLKTIIEYLNETIDCRSRFIASYFGDHDVRHCGICDNCLNQQALQITKEEFEIINHKIVDSVKQEAMHARALLQQLTGIKKEKAWKVINFLQAENKIELDKTGYIHLK
jgi:ATP-dependent DNA helicase RecQ